VGGGWSFGDPAVWGRGGVGRWFATTTAMLLLAGLLICGAGGCGGTPESEGAATPDLSTATTGEDQSSSVTEQPRAGTTEAKTTSTIEGMELGTRRNPIPLGQEAQVGDWTVKVPGAVLDATQTVLDENMFNDPPESGSQYVLVTIEATYNGQESSTFWVEMTYSFVGGKGNTFDSGMAVAPDSILDEGETFPGGTISGNLVFVVESAQLAGGTVMIEESFTFDETRLFFAVR
jgi:hypothetical protein